jgi:Cof subfamily protein (haloacid dehalogenase superfamily)
MAIRLIAIDVDGTLLDSRWQVPEANRAAIAAAAERGIEIALVTGRRFDFVRPIAEELPCPLALIVNNGALIKAKDGRTHVRHLLPREAARSVLAATAEFRPATAVVFDRAAAQVVFEHLDWNDPERRSYFERNRQYLEEIAPLEASLEEDPIQVMFSGPVEAMRRVARELARLAAGLAFTLAVTEYEQRNFSIVDVIRQGCSKGAALAEWTRRCALEPAEVLAIGDNLNDREMLEFAGQAVVMGNSVPELKTLGWPVTLSNDENGVARAIEQYALAGVPRHRAEAPPRRGKTVTG